MRLLQLSLIILLTLPNASYAETAEEKGYAISKRTDESDNGFSDSIAKAKMILTNKAGQSTEREFTFRTLERASDKVGDKSIVVFESPRDIYGTALLSHAQLLDPDDQWLYLPALKRIKRISSANKSGPFVGSEFAYEDFTSQELGKYRYTFIREEELDGMKMDVVERYPLYENSGYTRIVGWSDQDIYQSRKVDYYDRKNALLKTLTFTNYKEYGDGIWRPLTLTMVNHQTGKETVLQYEGYQFKTGLTDNDFVKNVLKRIR